MLGGGRNNLFLPVPPIILDHLLDRQVLRLRRKEENVSHPVNITNSTKHLHIARGHDIADSEALSADANA